jgi:carboxymethylenebutenolidase
MSETRRIGALPQGHPRMLPPAETAIHTGTNGLVAGAVWIPVDDGELPAYRAMPAGAGPHPILLVLQEVFGADEYLQDVCRRAAHEGFVAIAPELFARQGKPGEATSREDLFKIALAVPDAQVLADMDACVRWAVSASNGDPARLGTTGFCWGGRIVWLYAAHNRDLRAGVAWYGRLVGETGRRHPKHPVDVAGSLHAPVLGLYGAEDPAIPLDSVDQMKARLAEARSPSEFVVYDGAPHAFHADYRPSYRPDAARDGWSRMLAWLRRYGAG